MHVTFDTPASLLMQVAAITFVEIWLEPAARVGDSAAATDSEMIAPREFSGQTALFSLARLVLARGQENYHEAYSVCSSRSLSCSGSRLVARFQKRQTGQLPGNPKTVPGKFAGPNPGQSLSSSGSLGFQRRDRPNS